MKKLLTLIILCAAAIIIKCSDDNPAGPDEPDYTLIVTDTIGPAGGTVASADILLSAPSGAFSGDVEIKFYLSDETHPFGGEGISELYLVDGIPDEYSQPLHICIKYSDTLTEDGFIAIGEEVFVPSYGDMSVGYQLFEAVDSSGYLVFDLPVPEGDVSSKLVAGKSGTVMANGSSLRATAVTRVSPHTTANGHFRIYYPSSANLTSIQSLGNYLEFAYEIFQLMGFSYTARTSWPVKVTVKDLQSEFGAFMTSKGGDNYGYMEINTGDIDRADTMRVTAGHEFFHLVQSLYDPRNRISKANGWFYKHYWLDEACAVWSEELFTSQANFISDVFPANDMEAFTGMHAGAATGARAHGYGLAPLIAELHERYDDECLVNIYEEIKADKNPADAVIDGVSLEPTYWLPFFYENYVFGTYYGVPPSKFVANRHQTYTIDDMTDTLETYNDTFPDLSARMYLIQLNYSNSDDNDAVKIKATGSGLHPEIVAFKYRQGVLESLGHDIDSLTLPGVKSLADAGWSIFAVVVNTGYHAPDYNTKSQISVEIRLKGSQVYNFNYFTMGYKVNGSFEDETGATWDNVLNSIYCCRGGGGFEGNRFDAVWDSDFTNGHSKGFFWAIIDPYIDSIISYRAVDTIQNNDLGVTYAIDISGGGIPLDYQYEGGFSCRVSGPNTCSRIPSFKWKAITYDGWIELMNHTCDETSYISIGFSREQ